VRGEIDLRTQQVLKSSNNLSLLHATITLIAQCFNGFRVSLASLEQALSIALAGFARMTRVQADLVSCIPS